MDLTFSSMGKRYQLRLTKTSLTPPPFALLNNLRQIFQFAQHESGYSWKVFLNKATEIKGPAGFQSDNDIREAIADLVRQGKVELTSYGADNKDIYHSGSTSAGSGGGGSASKPKYNTFQNKGPEDPPPAKPRPNDKESTKSQTPSKDGVPQALEQLEGDPVSMFTGEEMLEYVDAVLPGPVPFVFQRTYRSSHTRDVGLGVGWSHSGSEYFTLEGGKLIYIDGEGRRLNFAYPTVGQRSKFLPEGLSLDREDETTLVLKRLNEPDKIFKRLSETSSQFRLHQIRHDYYKPLREYPTRIKPLPERGYCLNFHYNDRNHLQRIEGNWGKSLRFKRNDLGKLISIDLVNVARKQERTVATYSYNASHDLIAHKNAKGVGETFDYKNHLLVKRTLITGFSFYFEWDGDDQRARCKHTWGDRGIYECYFDWDVKNHRSTVLDSRGGTTAYAFNAYGQIIQKTDPEGGEHQYQYEDGQLAYYTDPENHTTEYFRSSENHPAGGKDACGTYKVLSYFKDKLTSITIEKPNVGRVTWTREYQDGLLKRSIDTLGFSTCFQHNEHGLVTERWAEGKADTPGGKRELLTGKTRYEWNDQAELVSITDPNGHRRELRYNPWGQISESELFLNNPETDEHTSAGKVRFEYTPTGQISQIIAANGDVTNYAYNDNDQLIRHSDPQGRVTQFKYDGLSQVVERIDAEGHKLRYEYDTERNLTALINENGDRYSFEYDKNERLIKEIGFDGRVQEYQYNKSGHLIQHRDAGEALTEFERDPMGRMTQRKAWLLDSQGQPIDDPSTHIYERFSYDYAGQLRRCNNLHRFVELTYNSPGLIAEEHSNDLLYQPNRAKEFIGAGKLNTIQAENRWPNQIDAYTLPDGQRIDYYYNDRDNFKNKNTRGVFTGISIGQPGQEKDIISLEVDALGRETQRHQGALTTHTDYDPAGRLNRQHSVFQTTKKHGPVQREYTYNDFGNLEQLIDGDHATRYVYDFIDRLQSAEHFQLTPERDEQGQTKANHYLATPTQKETFAFDPASNLIGITNNSDNQNNQNTPGKIEGNRLVLQGDKKFTYDKRGNLIQENRGKDGALTTKYFYNAINQLIKVEKNGQTTEYTYDPLGRRIRKKDNFGETEFLWFKDQLIQETRNNIKKTYIYEPESFRPVAMLQDDKVYHYHNNHLGTPTLLTDEEGKVVWKAKYATYGNVAVKEVEEVENNLRFQGQYWDEESGLHYNRFRYYSPSLGQFITPDPIGLLGGANSYKYVTNPVQWLDPLGQTEEKENNSIFSAVLNIFSGIFSSKKKNSPNKDPLQNSAPVAIPNDKQEVVALINGKKFKPTGYGSGFHGMRIPQGMTVNDLFEQGLPKKGSNIDLINHASGGKDSAFRGTSPFLRSQDKAFGGPIEWADDGGIVVDIEGAPMFNVNELLEGRVENAMGRFGGNVFTAESENAVFANVASENIRAIAKVRENSRGKLEIAEWIKNPNFKE